MTGSVPGGDAKGHGVAVSLLVILFLMVVVAVGYVATLATDVELRAEERLVFGVVVGTIVVATVGFGVAWILGMNRAAMVTTMSISALMVMPLASGREAALLGELADLRRRFSLHWRDVDNPWPVFALLLISAVVSGRILALAYGTTPSGGITVGHLSTYGDWSAHLAYSASFAYADNFPPELPTAVGETFAYHFGIDWFAAMFVPLGASLEGGLQLSAWILATVFPAVMYTAARRMFASRLGAGLGVLVFLASGGTAALYRFLFVDLRHGGIGVLRALPRTYAFDGFDRNWVDNAVTGFLYPQRPTLIGFAVTVMVLALLWDARDRPGHRTHLAAGMLMMVMPVFHVFTYVVLLAMAAFWAASERSSRWVAFFAPALVGLVLVWWQWPSENGRAGHFFWVLGLDASSSSWHANVGDFLWFWFLNTGLYIPLAAVGLWRLGRQRAQRLLPAWGLLLVPNLAIWHFWEGNNAKYVLFFLLIAAPLVGEQLAAWFTGRGALRVLAAAVLVTLTLSGGLDIWRAFDGSTGSTAGAAAYPVGYLTPSDVLVGEWVRDNTPPHAVFATAANNVHPIRAIAGRTVVAGSAGRLRDLGVDWYPRVLDLQTLYGVYEGYDAVLAKYGIDFVVVSNAERSAFRPDDAPSDWDPAKFWDAAAPLVYAFGDYRIYDVRGYQ